MAERRLGFAQSLPESAQSHVESARIGTKRSFPLVGKVTGDGRAQPIRTTRIDNRSTAPANAPLALDDASIRSLFTVSCEPLQKVNYCSLHNGRDLFSAFNIQKNVPGLAPPVEVRVELTAENETRGLAAQPDFRRCSRKRRPPQPCACSARSARFATRAGKHTIKFICQIRCGSHLLLQQSNQVTLLPIDEWRH